MQVRSPSRRCTSARPTRCRPARSCRILTPPRDRLPPTSLPTTRSHPWAQAVGAGAAAAPGQRSERQQPGQRARGPAPAVRQLVRGCRWVLWAAGASTDYGARGAFPWPGARRACAPRSSLAWGHGARCRARGQAWLLASPCTRASMRGRVHAHVARARMRARRRTSTRSHARGCVPCAAMRGCTACVLMSQPHWHPLMCAIMCDPHVHALLARRLHKGCGRAARI